MSKNVEREKITMKNKTFMASIKCAVNGLVVALRTEKNYKFYIAIAIVFLVINVVAQVGVNGYLAYAITVASVFAAECINTAVEHFVDMFSTEIRPEIKHIKDIAAANVLCCGFGFFACEIIMLWNKLV